MLDRRGFTLIELLTAIAIFVVLLGILFVPLNSSLRSVREANIYLDLQDTARIVGDRLKREIPTAIYAWDPSPPIIIGIAPDGLDIWAPYAKLDILLPLKELYCEVCGQTTPYPTNEPSYPYICPNCGNQDQSKLHFRLHRPLTPKGTILRLFIGLREPGVWDDNLQDYTAVRPYGNLELLRGGEGDNFFCLYKVEFNPKDPRFANWQEPNFFYDLNLAPDGKTYMYHWKKNAVNLTPPTIDAVDVWKDGAGVLHFEPLISFLPRYTREVLQPLTNGQIFWASYGLWAGVQNDGTKLFKELVPPNTQVWPHIVVVDRTNTVLFDSWYDSWSDPLSRYFTWDSRRGIVNFVFWGAPENPIIADGVTYQYPLPQSRDPLSKTPIPNAYIIPGTETVKVNGVPCKKVEADPQTYTDSAGNRIYEYSIDYDRRLLIFNALYPPAQGSQIEVTYYWSTLQRGDVVWAQYPSAEEIMVAIGNEKAFDPERKYPFWVVHTIRVENARR